MIEIFKQEISLAFICVQSLTKVANDL